MVKHLRDAGSFDDVGFIVELQAHFKELESEDYKTALDLLVGEILVKDKTEGERSDEILSLRNLSPQVFNSILS